MRTRLEKYNTAYKELKAEVPLRKETEIAYE